MISWPTRSVTCSLLFSVLAQLAWVLSLGAADRALVFGRVQDDPVKAIRDRQGFVDYMAKKLSPLGFTGGKILVVDKIHLLSAAIAERKVDLFHDSAVPTIMLAKSAKSNPILNQWKYGEAEYFSVIIVKHDSAINSLADLKGKVIAFDEPHSTSAHVLPRMLLAEKKLKMYQVIAPDAKKPDAVGFVHCNDGDAPHLLITGRVDAAATSYREFEEMRPEIKQTLKIIAKSQSVPRLLISVRKDLEPKTVTALRDVLLNMHNDPEGKEVLQKQQKTTRIDDIPPAMIERLKTIENFVFSSLGDVVKSW